MQYTISNISMNDTQLEALRQAAYNAGNVVGRREVREANIYALKGEDGPKFVTTFDNTFPGPWSFRVCSTRWSQSQNQYVAVVNDFCEETLAKALLEDLTLGREAGAKQYAEANAVNDKFDALEKKALARFPSQYGTLAYFEQRDDAEAWAEFQAASTYAEWSAVYVAFENDPLVHAIVGAVSDETGTTLDGLWRAYVGKTTKAGMETQA